MGLLSRDLDREPECSRGAAARFHPTSHLPEILSRPERAGLIRARVRNGERSESPGCTKSLAHGCTADSQCLFKTTVLVANSVLLTTTVCKVLRELYTSQTQQAATRQEASLGDGEGQKGGWERGPQPHSSIAGSHCGRLYQPVPTAAFPGP